MAEQFVRVVAKASELHAFQRRKGKSGEPYINHPIRVAELLLRCGCTDWDILSAAVLHDTVEDTAYTIEDVERDFGATIASLVAEVTDDKSLPKLTRKKLQVEHALTTASLGARLIKLADKWDNIQSIGKGDIPPTWTTAADVQGYVAWSHAVCDAAASPEYMESNEAMRRLMSLLQLQAKSTFTMPDNPHAHFLLLPISKEWSLHRLVQRYYESLK